MPPAGELFEFFGDALAAVGVVSPVDGAPVLAAVGAELEELVSAAGAGCDVTDASGLEDVVGVGVALASAGEPALCCAACVFIWRGT